jgi:hypothetical protein
VEGEARAIIFSIILGRQADEDYGTEHTNTEWKVEGGLAGVWQRLSQIEAKWLYPVQSMIAKSLDNICCFWPLRHGLCPA